MTIYFDLCRTLLEKRTSMFIYQLQNFYTTEKRLKWTFTKYGMTKNYDHFENPENEMSTKNILKQPNPKQLFFLTNNLVLKRKVFGNLKNIFCNFF